MQRKRRRLERGGVGGVEGERNGAWMEAVVVVVPVEEAEEEGDAFIIRIAGLFWRPEAFCLLGEIYSLGEGDRRKRLSVATYGDVKDREKEVRKG
ncbi:hypothetical protein K0M31_006940 [Melipona bicolor]|uniref:Uncharacterized protein n=1 Tax=Melipona bicolor TaxID=60889 RepID=A0AA40KKL9_9HYME|nr:hypothetical protein K0M31_006940 [Melipona bicolor]